jgi:hypothetical protein
MSNYICHWAPADSVEFVAVGIAFTHNFPSLIESVLGRSIAAAVRVLCCSTLAVRGSQTSQFLGRYLYIYQALAEISGTRVLEHLQGFLSSKSLEKSSPETRVALFLTLLATTISVRYHYAFAVGFYILSRIGK